MRICRILALTAISLMSIEVSVAGPDQFEKKGFISNEAGNECWYQQQVISGALHFHGDAIATTIGEIVFDDPECMRDFGNGLQDNKKRINEQISKWYSHPDADFDTENLRESSLYQVTGECMQSRSYAAIAVAIDYVVVNHSIIKVLHGPTLEGCIS